MKNGKPNIKLRAEIVKAMDLLVRCVNDENITQEWLTYGVADGDCDFSKEIVSKEEIEDLSSYITEDGEFADLMGQFLHEMSRANNKGEHDGLYVDGVASR